MSVYVHMGENWEDRAFERTDNITVSAILSFLKKKDVRGGESVMGGYQEATVNMGKGVMQI